MFTYKPTSYKDDNKTYKKLISEYISQEKRQCIIYLFYLYFTRDPEHVYHPAKCTGHPTNFIPPYTRLQKLIIKQPHNRLACNLK